MNPVQEILIQIREAIQFFIGYARGRVEYRVHVHSPVTENNPLQIRANVLELQNAGTSTVTLDDCWTLRPGQTKTFGDASGPRGVIVHEFKVRFSEGGTNRLEVLTLSGSHEYATGNYIDKP